MDNAQFRQLRARIHRLGGRLPGNDRRPARAAPLRPGEIAARLPADPPGAGESMDSIFNDFNKIIMPGMTHWQHPGWHAYFPANNSPESILAELLTAGIGAQGMSWVTSPAATELEDRVLDWLRQMIGLPEGFTGVIQDTASTATLTALLSARERATGFEANEKGLRRPLTVYASSETHSSLEKGVKIAGYGRENLRFVPVDSGFAMIPEALEEAVRRDKAAGFQPAFVAATLGTTSSTAVDPLGPIGEIAARHGLWLHVDAAYGGTAALCPGEPLDPGGRGAGGFVRLQSPQMDADQLRLLGLLRPGPGHLASGPSRSIPNISKPGSIPTSRTTATGASSSAAASGPSSCGSSSGPTASRACGRSSASTSGWPGCSGTGSRRSRASRFRPPRPSAWSASG